jgi:hypothetical protein
MSALLQRAPLVQGVALPHDVSAVWLCERLSHPDNFLYIVFPIDGAK